MFHLDDTTFKYEPFPYAIARNVLSESFYNSLIDSFPRHEELERCDDLGSKFLLTESDGENYYRFLASSPPWQTLYKHVKSREFVSQVLKTLADANIDLGLQDVPIVNDDYFAVSPGPDRDRRETRRNPRLSSRLEFSSLPADSGSHRPHTDIPTKAVSMILPMVRSGEWQERWGGGTAICKPRDAMKNFNLLNRYLDFDDVEVIEHLPFAPSTCVILVKTFNSWHTVPPITGSSGDPPRRTVAINIDHHYRDFPD